MSVKTFADQYNQFQHQFGQDVEQNYQEIIASLFSPEFKKIVNGAELVRDRSQLLNQLVNVKDIGGQWSIQPIKIIPSDDNTLCTIRYLLHSEKMGKFDVIAIMSISNGQIDCIDEIYYQPEGDSHG